MSKKPNGKRLNEHQRCEIISSSQPQSQTQKTPKLMPNDDSRHVQLINLNPIFFAKKCVLIWNVYLNGCVLKWEVTVECHVILNLYCHLFLLVLRVRESCRIRVYLSSIYVETCLGSWLESPQMCPLHYTKWGVLKLLLVLNQLHMVSPTYMLYHEASVGWTQHKVRSHACNNFLSLVCDNKLY